jgi:hypothetical protein
MKDEQKIGVDVNRYKRRGFWRAGAVGYPVKEVV